MANWNLPSLTSLKANILDELKARDVAVGTMNPADETNLPTGWIAWSAANNRFEIWSGSAFVELSSLYEMSVRRLEGQTGAFYRNASNLNSGTVPVARLPTASTGARGAVQLSTSTTSTSTSQAATPSSVNSVRQIAEARAPASHSHGAGDLPSASTSAPGVVQLSTSTSSTSTSQAATPSAVNSVRQVAEARAPASHSHAAGDLPSASTSAPGVVQLNTSTTSTSTSQAATPSAVNSVRQVAESRAPASHSHAAGDLPSASTSAPGVVQLSTSTTSTSTSQAATPSAVNAVNASKANLSGGNTFTGTQIFDGDIVLNDDGDIIEFREGASWRLRIRQSGISFGSYIDVRNNLGLFILGSAGSALCRFEQSGALTAAGSANATAFNTTSDPKLKKNIKPFDGALAKLGQISGYRYALKATNEASAGLLSTEVKKVLPEAVTKLKGINNKLDYESVNYNAVVGLLVSAVNELSEKVQAMPADSEA